MSATSAGWYHPTHGTKTFSWSFSGNFHVTQVFKDPGFFKLTDKILLNNYCDGDTMTYDQYKRGELDDHGSLKNDLLRNGWLMKTIDQSFGDKKVCSLVYTRGYPLSVASARKAVESASLYIPADKDSKYSIELWDGVSRTILLALTLSLTPAAFAAETIVIPVQDMLFVCPDFDDAPDFNLNRGINGQGDFIGDKKPTKKTKSRKETEKELVSLVEMLYPNAKVRVIGDNLVIRMP
jgi:hypothetical protein